MSGKEHLTQNIKKWLQVDKEMKMLQKELKDSLYKTVMRQSQYIQ